MRTVYLIVAIAIFLTIYVLKNKIKKVSLKVLEQFRIVFGISFFFIYRHYCLQAQKSQIYFGCFLMPACCGFRLFFEHNHLRQ